MKSVAPVGINGIGRIGKLLTWLLSSKGDRPEVVVSTGRRVAGGIEDLAAYLEYDSTYGRYDRFISGLKGGSGVEIRDRSVYLNDMKITWLDDPEYRKPGKIPWGSHGVDIVFDTTGRMRDPTEQGDESLRGHLNHAKKVILTAPFKVRTKGAAIPEDAVTVVGGVNVDKYDSAVHDIISNASCTTNCVAPPIKALVDAFGDNFVSFSLTTVHSSTNTQSILDSLPKDGDMDTRKRRSIYNNIIPTTTGAAKALLEVIPQIREIGIGSQASAIRVPTSSASIVVLDISLIGEYDNDQMHSIFRDYSLKHPEIMYYSDKQLVSSDVIGSVYSTIYDAPFTHRRTSKRNDEYYTMFDLNFWYDNEFGYVSSLARLLDTV